MGFKNTLLPVQNSISSKGKLLCLDKPVVMGILNITPDSFYERSRYQAADDILRQAERMIADGAAILDIGGASTRPGADPVPVQEELQRVLPVIQSLQQHFPEQWLSVDTFHAAVAEAAVAAGARIVNDIGGGRLDPDMIPLVARLQVPYIAMHMEGNINDLQAHPDYTHITQEILANLVQLSRKCADAGIKDLILDPGFGFGKTRDDNYTLLAEMSLLRITGRPILTGISRKSMIYKTLGTDAAGALNASSALHMVALQQGSSILRVHDVREALEVIRLFGLLPEQAIT